MTLKEASKHALTILKQVMEEKLNATNIEVFNFMKQKNNLVTLKIKNVNFLRCQQLPPKTSDFIYSPKKKSRKSLRTCKSQRPLQIILSP